MANIISFLPIQEGTGTPSPDNVRPIKPALTIDGIGDIYGGSIDADTGVLTEEWDNIICDGSIEFSPYFTNPNVNRFNKFVTTLGGVRHKGDENLRQCPLYNWCGSQVTYLEYYSWLSNQSLLICVPKTIDSAEAFSAYLAENPLQVCYERETPITHSLTPTQLNSALKQLGYQVPSLQVYRRRILSSPHPEYTSGNLCTFSTDIASNLKECKVHFSPIQEGSGDPSPDNIRSISGWDGMDVVRCGKNLLTDEVIYRSAGSNLFEYTLANGAISLTIKVSGYSCFVLIKVFEKITQDMVGLRFKYSASSIDTRHVFVVCNSDGSDRLAVNGQEIEILPQYVGKSLTFRWYATDNAIGTYTASNMQVEIVPSTTSQPTAYEPYTASSFPISWAQQGTVYGGYVDLVSGEVWAEWAVINVTGSQTLYGGPNASYNGAVCTNRYIMLQYNSVVISYASTVVQDHAKCDKLSPISKPTWSTPDNYPWCCVINNRTQFHFSLDNATLGIQASDNYQIRDAAIASWLTQNPLAFVYELATPQLIATLTPTQIKALKGINTIYSNANEEIDVKYWKH